ncbi:unnamed protein product, partial [Symbiodinium necroappetens]
MGKNTTRSALTKQPAAQGKRTKSPNLPTTQHTTADEKKLLKKFEQYKERQKFKTFKKMLKEERRQKKAKKQTRATKLA